MDLCWALGVVTWEPTAAAGRRCWFCWGMSCRWLRCRIHGLPVTTSQGSTSSAFQGCQPEPWAVPRQLGQAAGTVSSGTCWPCPSECTVPSPASLLPKALQAVAELLHREHPGILPATLRNCSWTSVTSPNPGCCSARDFCMLDLCKEHPAPSY